MWLGNLYSEFYLIGIDPSAELSFVLPRISRPNVKIDFNRLTICSAGRFEAVSIDLHMTVNFRRAGQGPSGHRNLSVAYTGKRASNVQPA